jgi:hypothetical protein
VVFVVIFMRSFAAGDIAMGSLCFERTQVKSDAAQLKTDANPEPSIQCELARSGQKNTRLL